MGRSSDPPDLRAACRFQRLLRIAEVFNDVEGANNVVFVRRQVLLFRQTHANGRAA
jgi:hypothetical protein